jgi:hypothetical protein
LAASSRAFSADCCELTVMLPLAIDVHVVLI